MSSLKLFLAEPVAEGISNGASRRLGVAFDQQPDTVYAAERFVSSGDVTRWNVQAVPNKPDAYYIWARAPYDQRFRYLRLASTSPTVAVGDREAANGSTRVTIGQDESIEWQFMDIRQSGAQTFALCTLQGNCLDGRGATSAGGYRQVIRWTSTTVADNALLFRINVALAPVLATEAPTPAPSSAPTETPIYYFQHAAFNSDHYLSAPDNCEAVASSNAEPAYNSGARTQWDIDFDTGTIESAHCPGMVIKHAGNCAVGSNIVLRPVGSEDTEWALPGPFLDGTPSYCGTLHSIQSHRAVLLPAPWESRTI